MSTAKVCPQCGRGYAVHERFCTEDGAALVAPAAGAGELVGSVVAERYHVIKKLGEGGMGQVYLAEHVRMGRMSALKVLRPGTVHDGDAIARFNREASNASRVNHPHVASIYDFGETRDGLIFLAMEYVDGEPLTRTIERGGALPPARVAAIVSQVAAGLGAAHRLGIVHRDLKPDNIMVGVDADGADLVKLVDFGIAKVMQAAEQRVTGTGLVIGTPAYMSPEQLTGQGIDARTDIYALGIVTFNMLTGSLPFTAQSAHGELLARLTDRPRTLAEALPQVPWPPAFQSVLDRALAREPADRYERATDLGRDLIAAVESAPDIAGAATAIGVPLPRVPTTLQPPPRTTPTPALTGAAAPATGAPVTGAPVTGAPVTAAPAAGSASPATTAGSDSTRQSRRRWLVASSVLPAIAAAAVAYALFGPDRQAGAPRPAGESAGASVVVPRSDSAASAAAAAPQPGARDSSPAGSPAGPSAAAAARDSAQAPNKSARAPTPLAPQQTRTPSSPAATRPDSAGLRRYAQSQPPSQLPDAGARTAAAPPTDSGTRAAGSTAGSVSGGTAAAVPPTTSRPDPVPPVAAPAGPSLAEESRLVETLAADVAGELTRAFNQRSFAQAGRVAQALPPRTRDGFAQLLADRDNSNFSATLDGQPTPVLSGGTAVAPINFRLTFRNRSAGMMRQSLSYVATFRREPSGWQLVTLQPK